MADDDDSVPTPTNPHDAPGQRGELPHNLQLAKIIMGTPADKGGYIFSAWNGKDPRKIPGRFVFILSKLEDRDIYPYITMGDLVKLQSLDTDNILIPTESLLGRHMGDRYIGTYLDPPSSMSQQHGKINLQQAQTFLPNLMRDGRILMRVFKNPYNNTFWYKFNEGESSNIDIKNHLKPLHTRLNVPINYFIHKTLISNIFPNGKYYQPLRDYIPPNPEGQFFSSLSGGPIKRSRGKSSPENSKISKPNLEGGKSRRKLKTTNKRTNKRTNRRRNKRTTKRRNTRTNRRRNTKKRRN